MGRGDRVALVARPDVDYVVSIAATLLAGAAVAPVNHQFKPRELAAYFETAESEFDAIRATLIVPLKIEGKLTGILLVGEKLYGDIFDDQ